MSESAKEIVLDCRGFFRQVAVVSVPDHTGVYFVFGGEPTESGCRINRLIYIGRSADLHSRLQNHERLGDLRANLGPGEDLYYSYAFVANADLDDAERALVKHFSNGSDLCNVPGTNGSSSSLDLVRISLTGNGVPRIFGENDRVFTVQAQES